MLTFLYFTCIISTTIAVTGTFIACSHLISFVIVKQIPLIKEIVLLFWWLWVAYSISISSFLAYLYNV
jgi:hypothetical protein